MLRLQRFHPEFAATAQTQLLVRVMAAWSAIVVEDKLLVREVDPVVLVLLCCNG
jgi:hypothetical protein